MSSTGLIVAAAAVLAVAAAALWWRRRKPPLAPPPADDWQAGPALARLLESTPEIHQVYGKLGYSLAVEWESARLLRELEELIEVEVPDHAALREALDKIEHELTADLGDGAGPLLRARRERFDDPLLQAVLAARERPAEVLALLGRDPVGEMLPLVEEIPFFRGGRVVWRTPVAIDLVRKRPRDPKRFARLLGDLDRLVRGAPLRRGDAERRAVLDGVARVGRELARENAYLPTSIHDLADKLDAWLGGTREPLARERRRQLEELLAGLLELRHRFPDPPPVLAAADLEAFRERARQHGDAYLRAEWMHCRPITELALVNLVAAELAEYPEARRRKPSSPGGVLARVGAEIGSGHFDSRETVHRLHRLEARGHFVHSLIFGLLRLC